MDVSNFNHKQIERVLEKAKIKPTANQIKNYKISKKSELSG